MFELYSSKIPPNRFHILWFKFVLIQSEYKPRAWIMLDCMLLLFTEDYSIWKIATVRV